MAKQLVGLCVALLLACGGGSDDNARAQTDPISRAESLAAEDAARAESLRLAAREAAIDAARRADSLDQERRRPRTLVLFDVPNLAIRAGLYEPTSFGLDSAGDCTLDGTVDVDRSQRQESSDVEVLVLRVQDLDEWGKSPQWGAANALFRAGPQARVTIHASITEAGGYILVISNRFSASAPTTASVNASIVCTGTEPHPVSFALPGS
jgi:hypothetical protein